jgi:hypothetical protein
MGTARDGGVIGRRTSTSCSPSTGWCSRRGRATPSTSRSRCAEIDGDLVDVGLEWGGRDEARGTRVVLRLPTALREAVRLDRDGAGRRPTERELIGALQAAGDEVRIGPSTIELLLPAVALDPRAVLPIVAVMARLSRLLIGTPRAAAPYR